MRSKHPSMSALGRVLLVCCCAAMPAAAQDAAILPPQYQPVPGSSSAPTPRQQLELDSTAITVSGELPTVLNILPWKQPLTGDLHGAPEETLLNQVMHPVNRVEFRRELRYAAPLAGSP